MCYSCGLPTVTKSGPVNKYSGGCKRCCCKTSGEYSITFDINLEYIDDYAGLYAELLLWLQTNVSPSIQNFMISSGSVTVHVDISYMLANIVDEAINKNRLAPLSIALGGNMIDPEMRALFQGATIMQVPPSREGENRDNVFTTTAATAGNANSSVSVAGRQKWKAQIDAKPRLARGQNIKLKGKMTRAVFVALPTETDAAPAAAVPSGPGNDNNNTPPGLPSAPGTAVAGNNNNNDGDKGAPATSASKPSGSTATHKEAKTNAEEEAKKKADAAKKKADAAKKKADAAKKKAEEAKKKEEEARKKEEEAGKKAEEDKNKVEEAKKKAEEARKKAEEAKKKAEEARKKAEEAMKKAEEARKKAEEDAKKKAEEDAKKKAEEARKKAEDAKKKAEEDAKKKAEEDAKKKAEEDARKKAEEDARKKAEDAQKAEAEEDVKSWLDVNLNDFIFDGDANKISSKRIDSMKLLTFMDQINKTVDILNSVIRKPNDANRNLSIKIFMGSFKKQPNTLGFADWEKKLIVLNIKNLEEVGTYTLNENEEHINIIVIVHEILHILGLVGVGDEAEKLVVNIPNTNRKKYMGVNGIKKYKDFIYILSPTYDTNYIKFIPLEDDFGEGTAHMHLEEGITESGRWSPVTIDGKTYPVIKNENYVGCYRL